MQTAEQTDDYDSAALLLLIFRCFSFRLWYHTISIPLISQYRTRLIFWGQTAWNYNNISPYLALPRAPAASPMGARGRTRGRPRAPTRYLAMYFGISRHPMRMPAGGPAVYRSVPRAPAKPHLVIRRNPRYSMVVLAGIPARARARQQHVSGLGLGLR